MRTIGLVLRRLLSDAAAIYCGGVIVLVALWHTAAQPPWWLALANVFALYLFAPLLLLAPAALVVRSRGLRSTVVVLVAIFLLLFGARLIPASATQARGAHLRVLTFNQLHGNARVEDVVMAVRGQDADVVALQELSVQVATAMRRQLGEMYPYQFAMASEREYGLGVFSRYPLREMRFEQGFSGQRMIVDVHGQPITLINVHLTAPAIRTRRFWPLRPLKVILDYNTAQRASEAARLLRTIDAIQGPLVVLGDFNTGDREPAYAEFAARMHDAYRETAWGFGFTFPNDQRLGRLAVPFPLVRIDYVWSRGGVMPALAWVDCASSGSDHCMLIADLRVGSDESNMTVVKGGDAPW